MRISVVLSTYDRPRDLALALAGYALQDDTDFELVVADDGSGPGTAEVIAAAASGPVPIQHVWQPDRGFRKTEILDRAIARCAGHYLVFSDGDCIPRPDFVSTHRRLAAPGRFLSGGCVRLPAPLSAALTADDVRDGWIWSASALRRRGLSTLRAPLRLLPGGALSALMDHVTPTLATWNGMNASTWKDAVTEVNGFELDLGYGGEDREFGVRLGNLGLAGRQVRHRAVLLHLHHARPYRDAAVVARQRAWRAEVRRSGRTRARRGIAELSEAPAVPSRETR
jgi:glycosyltransferase involved in cell wall biosynthesis